MMRGSAGGPGLGYFVTRDVDDLLGFASLYAADESVWMNGGNMGIGLGLTLGHMNLE